MPTLKKKDYTIALVTGVTFAVATLVITYAARKIDAPQGVRLVRR